MVVLGQPDQGEFWQSGGTNATNAADEYCSGRARTMAAARESSVEGRGSRVDGRDGNACWRSHRSHRARISEPPQSRPEPSELGRSARSPNSKKREKKKTGQAEACLRRLKRQTRPDQHRHNPSLITNNVILTPFQKPLVLPASAEDSARTGHFSPPTAQVL